MNFKESFIDELNKLAIKTAPRPPVEESFKRVGYRAMLSAQRASGKKNKDPWEKMRMNLAGAPSEPAQAEVL